MRLAILSDIHADVFALRDALAQAERLRCDAVVCAGDLVEYGLFAEETIALLRERCIPCIRATATAGRSDGEGRASGADVRRWLEEARAEVLVVGHTHVAFVLHGLGGRLVANPGALLREPGEKREGRAWLLDPDSGTFVPGPAPGGGAFGVVELPAKQFTVHCASDGEEVDAVVAKAGLRDRRGGRDR
jgi:predicted phosphodiesterase